MQNIQRFPLYSSFRPLFEYLPPKDAKAVLLAIFDLEESYAYELMCGWLHDAISDPYIRKVFSSIALDDEIMLIDFSLSTSIDEFSDEEFVISVFAQYMVIQWMKPQIESVLNTAFVLGGKEEKKIQANYKNNIERLDSLEIKLLLGIGL